MPQSPPTPRAEIDRTPENDPITMYSTTWCGDCRRAKRVFAALDVPYVEINIDEDEAAEAFVEQINAGMRSVPTIIFPDGTVLVEPGYAQLEAKLVPYAERKQQRD
jgi:mycoredoxin